MTLVERATSCVVGWAVGTDCGQDQWQAILDAAPSATLYYRDACPTYLALIYPTGIHVALPNKSQTSRVEGVNAELRHYLARLARRSRCFSRQLDTLRQAVKLFVYAWNHRQLYRHAHPKYPSHVRNFIYP
jgi:insertion element IS1 protein InsB